MLPAEMRSMLRDEYAQCHEEGLDVASMLAQVERAKGLSDVEVQQLYQRLLEAKPRQDYPYVEPTALGEIRALRPKTRSTAKAPWDEAFFEDRILGAYLARFAGCALGKPVENWAKEKIRRYLDAAKAWPLSNYFPQMKPFLPGLELNGCHVDTTLGNIHYMAKDDDVEYTILGLMYLEKHGPDFTTKNVGDGWQQWLPIYQTYTAERAAYRNLVDGYAPTETATRFNPYREWIGAQIRADGFGYAAPGLPEVAAELAWRDAVLSHVKNGVYGEMWVAAMLAAALASRDQSPAGIRAVLQAGLDELPEHCRLTEAIHDVMAWHAQNKDWEACWDKVNAKYGSYHPVHTINNAALVALGLLYGEADLEKTLCITVMAGWDTDCTGATAGSILGALLGARALPAKWVGPMNNTVRSTVAESIDIKISDLAKRSLEVAKKVRQRHA